MMQTTTQNVVVVPGYDWSTYPNYAKKSSLALGIVHLVIVFVVFVASVVGVALMDHDGPKGSLVTSMVASVLYIAAGICALVAGCNAKRGLVVASTVLNIICAIFAVFNVIAMVIAIAALHAILGESHSHSYRSRDADDFVGAILAICYVLLIVYLAQAVVTIWASCIGCSVTCCGAINQNNPQVVMTTTSGTPVVVPMHGQPMHMQQTSYAPPSYDHQAGGYNPGAGMPQNRF